MSKWTPVTEAGKKAYKEFGNSPKGATKFAEKIFNESNIEEFANLKKYEFDQECENIFEVNFILDKFMTIREREQGYQDSVNRIDDMIRELRNAIGDEMRDARQFEESDRLCPDFMELMDFADDRLYELLDMLRDFGKNKYR